MVNDEPMIGTESILDETLLPIDFCSSNNVAEHDLLSKFRPYEISSSHIILW